MSVQTDRLPPIIISEYAIQSMQKAFRSKLGFRPTLSKNELDTLFRKMQSSIMTLKYSYLSVDEIISHNEIQTLKEGATRLKDAIQPVSETKTFNQLPISAIKWGIIILEGLSRRLLSSTSEIGSGIDVVVVRVRNVQVLDKLLGIQVDIGDLAQQATEAREKMKQVAAEAMGEYIDYFTTPIWESGDEDEEEEEEEN